MKYFKCRDVISPTRAIDGLSVGIDFFVPKFNKKFINDLQEKNTHLTSDRILFLDTGDYIILKQHERILIPSGIKVNINESCALIAFNKSGVSTKKGLDTLACIVDPGYMGEVHISLVNTSDKNVYIYEDEKIVQFLMIPTIKSEMKEYKGFEELHPILTERGAKGFGSTGEK